MNREKPITRWPQNARPKSPSDGRVRGRRRKSIDVELSHKKRQVARALLIHAKAEPLRTLRVALANQGIETWRAHSCWHALSFLARLTVHVVFTDRDLPDGTWVDVAAALAGSSTPLIVVAQEMDPRLWSNVLQQGGCGLIAPPFVASDLAYAFQCTPQCVALTQVANHRRALAQDLFLDEIVPGAWIRGPKNLLDVE